MHSVTPLLADSSWLTLFHNPGTLVFMIPIVAILVGGIITLAKMLIRHRERMAMIERGMNPDSPSTPSDPQNPSTD